MKKTNYRYLPFASYFIWTLILTYPLIFNFFNSLPQGSESVGSVPLFNLWSLGWNVNQINHGYLDYWNAPIFYPMKNTFAFSELQPLTGLLAYPFWSISPAFAYNSVLVLFITLNGLSVFSLLRNLGTDDFPALLTGIVSMTLPFFTHERGVLQLQPFFSFIWAVNSLWGALDTLMWKRFIYFGLSVVITFFISEYYGLFLFVILIPLAIIKIRVFKSREVWTGMLIAVMIVGVIAGPILCFQLNVFKDYGFSRSFQSVLNNSAHLTDYLVGSQEIMAGRILGGEGKQLYSGLLLSLLGFVGVFGGIKKGENTRWYLFLISSCLLAFFLSFGLNFSIGGWKPYLLLYKHVPGFSNLRSPFRFAMWVQISLVLMSGATINFLWKSKKKITILIILLMIFEIYPRPVNLANLPKKLDLSQISGPTIFLPYVSGSSSRDYLQTTQWMFQSMNYDFPIVNGYSGYFPEQNAVLKNALVTFPDETSIRLIQGLRVDYIVIQKSWVSNEKELLLIDFEKSSDLVYVGELNGEYQVYQLLNGQ